MNKYWYKFLQFMWSTWLGGKYLEFLLWLDKQNGPEPVVTKHEVHQIVIQAQQLLYREGLGQIKRKVQAVVNAKTKEEYDRVLKELEDLAPLATKEGDKFQELKARMLSAYVKKDKDIKTASDHAKMIDRRIGDYQELREHKAKRKLLRDIREHKKLGNEAVAKKLQEEFDKRYVRRN